MKSGLTAVVIGAGMAGEGHTAALRYAGVEVVAICSRTETVVKAVAGRLGIPNPSTEWRQTLATVRPDIVSVATPAQGHVEQITAALEMGCHVLADKPLALTAADARRLYDLASQTGRKTALATTWMYAPGVAYLAELVAAGAIGRPLAVRSDGLTPWPYPAAATWMNRLREGGGLLNNRLPHNLAAVQRVVGGEVLRVAGEARVHRRRLPNVGQLHDYRQRRQLAPEEVAEAQWEEVDADDECLVLAHLGRPGDAEGTITAQVFCSTVVQDEDERTVMVYGTEGTLRYAETRWTAAEEWLTSDLFVSRFNPASGGWERERVPERIARSLPQLANPLHRDWAALARDFVADIRGEPHSPYPTFRQGWVLQQIVEAVRGGAGWAEIASQ